MKKQSGFTLIELAIVLVIIGLLLGGVLKGQELINSAKAKSIIADFKNAQIFIYGYQDKFRSIPGDDSIAGSHVNGGTVASSPASDKRGDTVIGGAWNSETPGDESYLFWQHIRLAGLATGSTDTTNAATFVPLNAEGGRIGVQSIKGFTQITDMTGSYVVCSANVSGRLAKQVDANLDDGETKTGNVRAVIGETPGAAVESKDVVDSTRYVVCMSF